MTAMLGLDRAKSQPDFSLGYLHLEITRLCQLSCAHCYNHSDPSQQHSNVDWETVIKQAVGCFKGVQFIGGEPLTHPKLYDLVKLAVNLGLEVEIYSNLFSRVRFESLPKTGVVKFATSFYSATRERHDRITGQDGSFNKTVSNIKAVLENGYQLRVGMVDFGEETQIAKAFLQDLGVERIKIDRIREIGRAATSGSCDPNSELCRKCGHSAAILFNGQVTSCPMARHLNYGDISEGLLQALSSDAANKAREVLFGRRLNRQASGVCDPQNECRPDCDPNDFSPTAECDPGCDPCWPEDGCAPDDSHDDDCQPACGPD